MFFVCFIDIFTIYKRLCNNNYILYHRSQYTSSNTSIHELTQHSSPYIKTSWYKTRDNIYCHQSFVNTNKVTLWQKSNAIYKHCAYWNFQLHEKFQNTELRCYFYRESKTIFFLKNKLIEGSFFILSQIWYCLYNLFQTLSISITMQTIKKNLSSIVLSNVCDRILMRRITTILYNIITSGITEGQWVFLYELRENLRR